jgi:putative membrane protein
VARAITAFLMYFGTGVAMTWVFTLAYIAITPGNELSRIRVGMVAPAITLAAAMLGFSFPLLSASLHGLSFLEFIVWGSLAGAVQVGVFFVFAHLFAGLWSDIIERDNVAAGIFCASLSLMTGLFNAFSLIP